MLFTCTWPRLRVYGDCLPRSLQFVRGGHLHTTYTHEFKKLIAAREELLFKSIRADTKIDQKRKEQGLIRRREDEEKKKGGDE